MFQLYSRNVSYEKKLVVLCDLGCLLASGPANGPDPKHSPNGQGSIRSYPQSLSLFTITLLAEGAKTAKRRPNFFFPRLSFFRSTKLVVLD